MKTLPAIYAIEKILEQNPNAQILLLVAERAHKKNWRNEFIKFLGEEKTNTLFNNITIECYASLKNYVSTSWTMVCLDECFRGDVEILTDKGFKRFDSLDKTEMVAQYNDNGSIEFVTPTRFIEREHHGKMVDWYIGKGRHCHLTPNHNIVEYYTENNQLVTSTIKDAKFYGSYKIPSSGKGIGNNKPLTKLERVFIAIQADGALQRHQIKESVYTIQLTKERKQKRFESLISRLNIHEIKSSRPFTKRWICKLPKGDAKLLSTHFDVNMGYDRARAFIDEVSRWDGSRLKDTYLYYSSKIKENADFVAAVAVQAGYTVMCSVEKDNRKDSFSPIYRVFMNEIPFLNTQCMKRNYYDYDDKVYCVEVPSHKIVVRSEGRVFVVGNCHHLFSDLRIGIARTITSEYILALSATLKREYIAELNYIWKNFYVSTISIQKSIDNGFIPEPEINLIPLELGRTIPSEDIVIEWGLKPKRKTIYCKFKDRWKYIRDKKTYPNVKLICNATQQEKYDYINEQFDYAKRQYMIRPGTVYLKNAWLQWGMQRKRYLGELKTDYVNQLLHKLRKDHQRILCFCTSIQQAKDLGGKNAVHSKNSESFSLIDEFNAKIKNELFAVNMLTEGVSLTEMDAEIIVQLDGNEKQWIQKQGRMYRSEHPKIYVFYFKNTRDEDFLKKAMSTIKSDYVKTINL